MCPNTVLGEDSREPLVARLADMWLLPRVRAHVRSQVAGLCEGIAARLADMWLLPRVRAHVLSQVAGRREPLVARLADALLSFRSSRFFELPT